MTAVSGGLGHEDVCACSHSEDDHVGGGPCSICDDPPCCFFWFRFSRETVNIRCRVDMPDPVGCYWKQYAPLHSDAWVFGQMSEADREEVFSKCWREARFDRFGNIECICDKRCSDGMPHCEEEFLCEVIACYLLVPPGSPAVGRAVSDEEDRELSEAYQMPVANLRFRRLLEVAQQGQQQKEDGWSNK